MILVTGATGFVGSRLLRALRAKGHPCRSLARGLPAGEDGVKADLSQVNALRKACDGVTTIYHCAGYAHAFSALSAEDSDAHWRINFEGCRNTIEAAGQAGVSRFVFLSSVKAMAEPGNKCVDEDFAGEPVTAYGQAKRAAETAVVEAGVRYGMHVVNLRLAMVYGSGGRGNLERMGNLVRRGVFPPLPETGNHRSLVHVEDVVSAMMLAANDMRASGQTYIVAGPDAPSGRQLYDQLRRVCGLPRCNWAVPEGVLRSLGTLGDLAERIVHRRMPLDSELVNRLLDSAWYSATRIERELGWRGKISLSDGLEELMCK